MNRPLRSLMGISLLLTASLAHAQGVGIDTSGAAADASAILDLSSAAKDFLTPRMTAAQRAAVVLPAAGLVVVQTETWASSEASPSRAWTCRAATGTWSTARAMRAPASA